MKSYELKEELRLKGLIYISILPNLIYVV